MLNKLTFSNFGLFKGTFSIDFENGVFLIEGENRDDSKAESNASGKSTLLNAIGWCLTGRTSDNKPVDKVATIGEANCFVEMEFDWCNLKRERTGKTGNIHFALTGDKFRKVSQEELDKIFGLNRDWFFSSSYLSQDFESFFDKKPAERKKLLLDFLPQDTISSLDSIYNKTKLKIKSCNEELIVCKTKIDSFSGRVVHEMECLDKAKESSETFKQDINATIKTLEKEKKEQLEITKDNLDSTNEDIKLTNETIDQLTEENNEALGNVKNIQQIRDQVMESLHSVQSKIPNIDDNISKFKKSKQRIEQLESGGKCPVCMAPVTDKSKDKCVKEIDKEIVSLENERNGYVKKYQTIQKEVDKVEKEYQTATQNERIISKKLTEQVSLSGSLKQEMKRYESSLISLEKDFDRRIELEKSKTNDFAQMEELHRTTIKKLKKEKVELDVDIEDINEELKLLEFIKEMSGPMGIKSSLFDQFLTELEDSTNNILEAVSDDIQVEYSSQKESQKGIVSDSLEIVPFENGELSNGLSGGQQQKVRIATSLALSEVLNKRSSSKIDFLVLDEPHRGLDLVGKENLFALVNKLVETGSKNLVLVASPQLDFKSMFGNTIKVIRENGESYIYDN